MILITGTSGKLGSAILETARSAGLDVLGGSSKIKVASEFERPLDFERPDARQLTDIETLLIVSAGYGEDDEVIGRHDNIISAAEAQGVSQIIYTSLTETGDHLAFALAHRWTEMRLKNSKARWTILRNGLYSELIGDLSRPVSGKITAPFGHAPFSPVARADLVDAAVTVLSDPKSHHRASYELAGASSWRLDEYAARLTAVYEPTTLAEERARLSDLPLLPFQPAMLMSIYSSASAGFLQADRTDLPQLLSATPRDSLTTAIEHL
jgi:NAD(P)H dehydrogenase (quinone)